MKALPQPAHCLVAASVCVAAVTLFHQLVVAINGPTRGVAFLYAPALAYLTWRCGLNAGLVGALGASAAFLVLIAPHNGLPADAISGLVSLVGTSGLVAVTAHVAGQRPAVSRPVGWLPFVADTDAGRSYWAIEETADYVKDCAKGRALARDLLHDMRRTGDTHALNWALADMIRAGRFSGVEAGFCSELGLSLVQDDTCQTDVKPRIVNGHHNGHARSVGDDKSRLDELPE
jgi:hypothetical protein